MRNRDHRCWLRDATLTLYALMGCGGTEGPLPGGPGAGAGPAAARLNRFHRPWTGACYSLAVGLTPLAPVELTLEVTPRARLDMMDVRSRAAELHGDVLEAYSRCLYSSPHTTAGYLPQSLATRLDGSPQGVRQYLHLFRAAFPENAGYRHDRLDERGDLAPAQRETEPTNGDSHLAFIAGGLHPCVSYRTSTPGPVYFIDLDGMHGATPRSRRTTLVGYNREVVVERTRLDVPVSSHPINAVNLKGHALGLYDRIAEMIDRHGVSKGRIRLELSAGEQYASLTVNEYETLLMQHDLAEVLRNPLRFAAAKARHAWNDPRALPGRAMDYARYDFVQALNQLVDVLGLGASKVERLVARALEYPASRFLRMRRSVDLLVSDSRTPGRGSVRDGTYQTPILIQWRHAPAGARSVDVVLTRFE